MDQTPPRLSGRKFLREYLRAAVSSRDDAEMRPGHRKPRKFRRTGQHAARSVGAVVARKAVWTAPAILAIGAVVASWQWTGTAVPPPGAAAQMTVAGPHTHHQAATLYMVRAGDSLSAIAQHVYGSARYWPGLYDINRTIIGADPEALDAGIVLRIPSRPDARAKTPLLGHSHAVYRPQHAALSAAIPAAPAIPEAPAAPAAPIVPAAPVKAAAPAVPAVPAYPAPHGGGTYSYSGLKRMWTAAGGSPAAADRAACIAEHESSGRPGAISPSNCYGLWQEMGRRDALDPATSARIAVSMSHGGTNWGAWSTSGMC